MQKQQLTGMVLILMLSLLGTALVWNVSHLHDEDGDTFTRAAVQQMIDEAV